jgi:hypothetical protein
VSLEAVQTHALARELVLPPSARDLERELRAALRHASDTGRLRSTPGQILQYLRLLKEPPPSVAGQLAKRGLRGDAACIVGGDKNQDRDRTLQHFERDDGAWFDFSIIVRERRGALELLAYDFELRFPPGGGAPFVRFDLNLPAHHNEERELRAHMHLGSDDLIAPAPMMAPGEVLALFFDGLRRPEDRPKPRAPTAFELGWWRETLAAHAPP